MNTFDKIISPVSSNPSVTAIICTKFASDDTHIALLYSSETEYIAVQLRGWLTERNFRNVTLHRIDPFKLGGITLPGVRAGQKILVDLTVGTKLTTVSLVQKLNSNEDRINLFKVYLKPDKKILVQNNENVHFEDISSDILQLDDVLRLHRFDTTGAKVIDIPMVMDKVLHKLAQIHSTREGIETYFRWKKRVLWKKCQPKRYKWHKEKTLKAKHLKFDGNGVLSEIGHIFSDNGTGVKIQEIADMLDLSCTDTCEFFTSFWLEYHVYNQLKKEEYHPKMNITSRNPKFEVDILLVENNDMYTISCTTIADDLGKRNSRSRIKHKLFEIITRARQLGGLKSRAIVVCLSNDPAGLQREIAGLQIASTIKVFGRDNLRNIGKEFSKWISSYN